MHFIIFRKKQIVKGTIDHGRDRTCLDSQKGRRDLREYPLTAEINVHLHKYLEHFVFKKITTFF